MNPLFHTGFSISDSLKSVLKSVLIYEAIIKKTGEEVAKRENVSVLVETNTRNKNGDVIGSQEQYVPGERITYRVNKICKKCGKGCYSTYRRDIPKV